MKSKLDLIKKIEALKLRGAWAQGVRVYALELLENYEGDDVPEEEWRLRSALLNGADTWHSYSWGGCSLIYDRDIALRLCNPSELKITKEGQRKPNKSKEWLDTQARALRQAFKMIYEAIK